MNRKKLIVGILVTAVVVVIFIVIMKMRAKKAVETLSATTTTGSNTSTTTATGSSASYSGFPIKKGSKGDYVISLQKALNTFTPIPYIPLVVDGVWGDKTEARIRLIFNGLNTLNKVQYDYIVLRANKLGIYASPLSDSEIASIKLMK